MSQNYPYFNIEEDEILKIQMNDSQKDNSLTEQLSDLNHYFQLHYELDPLIHQNLYQYELLQQEEEKTQPQDFNDPEEDNYHHVGYTLGENSDIYQQQTEQFTNSNNISIYYRAKFSESREGTDFGSSLNGLKSTDCATNKLFREESQDCGGFQEDIHQHNYEQTEQEKASKQQQMLSIEWQQSQNYIQKSTNQEIPENRIQKKSKRSQKKSNRSQKKCSYPHVCSCERIFCSSQTFYIHRMRMKENGDENHKKKERFSSIGTRNKLKTAKLNQLKKAYGPLLLNNEEQHEAGYIDKYFTDKLKEMVTKKVGILDTKDPRLTQISKYKMSHIEFLEKLTLRGVNLFIELNLEPFLNQFLRKASSHEVVALVSEKTSMQEGVEQDSEKATQEANKV